MSTAIIHRMRLYQQKHGTWALFPRALRAMASFVFEYRPVNLYAITAPPGTPAEARCPLDIRKGGPDDIERMVHLKAPIDPAEYRAGVEQAFAQGCELFLALSQGRLAHRSWLFYPPRVLETLVDLRLRPEQAHIGVCLTGADFRGMNIYPVVLQHIVRFAFEKGFKAVFIAAAPSNVASNRGIQKAGFTFVKKVSGFVLLGKHWNHRWQASAAGVGGGPAPAR
ncbi:MAG: hypothetical protein V2A79_13905 [Planctomycetota bacterium]